MKMLKNLEAAPKSEQIEFLNSCDQILCDVDGVVWRAFVGLPGSSKCIESFKKLGKNVKLVSNFSAWKIEKYQAVLNKNGINLEVGTEVLTPFFAITDYLKEINFDKKLYVIGSTAFKKELSNFGFSIAPNPPEEVTSLADFLSHLEDNVDIGAVVFEFDLNINLLKIQKALTYLKRKDCLYIVGSGDKVVPLSDQAVLHWNYHYQQLMNDLSGREPVKLAKPSSDFKDYIMKKFEITKPEKVLFIGDSVPEDIDFAKKCGFKTLLVLSGITKREDLENWQYSENNIPDYYIQDLNTLNNVLKNVFTTSL